MVDVYHVDVFQCNSVHSSDPVGIDPSWCRLGLYYLMLVLEYPECQRCSRKWQRPAWETRDITGSTYRWSRKLG